MVRHVVATSATEVSIDPQRTHSRSAPIPARRPVPVEGSDQSRIQSWPIPWVPVRTRKLAENAPVSGKIPESRVPPQTPRVVDTIPPSSESRPQATEESITNPRVVGIWQPRARSGTQASRSPPAEEKAEDPEVVGFEPIATPPAGSGGAQTNREPPTLDPTTTGYDRPVESTRTGAVAGTKLSEMLQRATVETVANRRG